MLPTPKRFTLCAGRGEGDTLLTAFDTALLNAGAGNLNLLKVSSILPPRTEHDPEMKIPPGSLVPTAYGTTSSQVPGEIISAAVAVGLPVGDTFGVIMEHSGHQTQDEIEKQIKGMVTEAFSNRGIPLKKILVAAVEHRVIHCGSVFAGLLLWY